METLVIELFQRLNNFVDLFFFYFLLISSIYIFILIRKVIV